MTTLRDLGLKAEIVDALAAQGIDEPFAIQAATIEDALAGRDVCGKAKTGSGKTLAFGLPALQTIEASQPGHPTALVLVPTRELAKQVVDVLSPIGKQIGVRVAAFYGGTSMERQIRNLTRKIEIAVATPGRLIDLLERGELDLDAIGILVIDEADRMADMGFLPQVEWIMRKVPNDRQTLLFSATLDREVDVLVRRYMRDPVLHEVVSDDADRRRDVAPLLEGARARPRQGARRDLGRRVAHDGVRAHQARRRQARVAAEARRRAPRPRSTATCASRRARRR